MSTFMWGMACFGAGCLVGWCIWGGDKHYTPYKPRTPYVPPPQSYVPHVKPAPWVNRGKQIADPSKPKP